MATHAGLAAETRDRRRHRLLHGWGWEVVVLTASDVMEHPRSWLVGLRETLLARGWGPGLAELHDIGARIDAVDSVMSRA